MSNLYSGKNAEHFSNTRNFPWSGWLKSIDLLKTQNLLPKTILDLGCGNARFLEFLNESRIEVEKYVGVDNSEELINIAKSKFPISNFQNKDLDEQNWDSDIKDKFDLVVSFGVLHHLRDFKSRKSLFDKSYELLNENGILIVTFWMFKEDENFMKKHLVTSLEIQNDFILSFGKDAQRFCHYSDEVERGKLIDKTKFEILDTFRSDGFGDRMNLYFVLKKVVKYTN